jgi:hypothetical protein
LRCCNIRIFTVVEDRNIADAIDLDAIPYLLDGPFVVVIEEISIDKIGP